MCIPIYIVIYCVQGWLHTIIIIMRRQSYAIFFISACNSSAFFVRGCFFAVTCFGEALLHVERPARFGIV